MYSSPLGRRVIRHSPGLGGLHRSADRQDCTDIRWYTQPVSFAQALWFRVTRQPPTERRPIVDTLSTATAWLSYELSHFHGQLARPARGSVSLILLPTAS